MTGDETIPTTARVLVLRTAGTNCDVETAHAFELAGAAVDRLHIGCFLRRERRLDEFDIVAIPGGFSYGDDLGAGVVLAGQLRTRLGDDLQEFVGAGRLLLGICNGFQVLVRLGILPGWGGEACASLIANRSGKFEDRWVSLRVDCRSSPFLSFARDAAPERRTLRLPVAHGEGRFVLRDPALVERLEAQGQIAFTYCRPSADIASGGEYPANPNGSTRDIAGITNQEGNVLGLMPHPERFVHRLQDPLWSRGPTGGADEESPRGVGSSGQGTRLFECAVRSVVRRS